MIFTSFWSKNTSLPHPDLKSLVNKWRVWFKNTIKSVSCGALNTPGILVFLSYFVHCDQQTNKKGGLHDKSHVIVSKAGSVISIICFQMERHLIHRAIDHWQAMQYRIHNRRWIAFDYERDIALFVSVSVFIYAINVFVKFEMLFYCCN